MQKDYLCRRLYSDISTQNALRPSCQTAAAAVKVKCLHHLSFSFVSRLCWNSFMGTSIDDWGFTCNQCIIILEVCISLQLQSCRHSWDLCEFVGLTVRESVSIWDLSFTATVCCLNWCNSSQQAKRQAKPAVCVAVALLAFQSLSLALLAWSAWGKHGKAQANYLK